MELMTIFITILCFTIGAIFGSFACCQAWRLRYKELGKKNLGKWSVCLSCGKRLKLVENIPIFSWLVQRGKCKSCGKKIGAAEILSEIGLALTFAGLGLLFAPVILESISKASDIWKILLEAAISLAVMIAVTAMWILLIYDAKWKAMPTKLLIIANICAVIYVGFMIARIALSGNISADIGSYLINLLGSVAILAGIYFLLYFASKEKLVGSGDWLLALPIALIIGRPFFAILILFLSNFFASIYGIIKKAKTKEKHLKIPFGPFLVIAFIIVYLLQSQLNQFIQML